MPPFREFSFFTAQFTAIAYFIFCFPTMWHVLMAALNVFLKILP